ncbi:MAG: glycosyl hydrolase family 65 protein [Roseiarcus sp.]
MVHGFGRIDSVALEAILGFRVHGANLALDPCIPRGWSSFKIVLRYRSARYETMVDNPLGVSRGFLAIRLDDEMLAGDNRFLVPLVDDGATHRVRVVLG